MVGKLKAAKTYWIISNMTLVGNIRNNSTYREKTITRLVGMTKKLWEINTYETNDEMNLVGSVSKNNTHWESR